jgi:SAM-dependent methyltransferase
VAESSNPRDVWNTAARGWDAGYEWYATNIRPLSDWFCRSVSRPGARVLDLACGTGQPALALARAVGERGHVVAIDIAPAMVESTRRRAREAALENVEALEMDASDLRFGARTFDAVTCACGLMFCPDPVRIVREAVRVLVPGGRVAVAVWDEPASNPFFTMAAKAIGSVLPGPPPDPRAPGPFRLGAPGELEGTFRSGGLVDIAVERLALTFNLSSVDEYWRIFTQFAAGVSERLASGSDADRLRALDALRASVESFVVDGALRLRATALCGTGQAPD